MCELKKLPLDSKNYDMGNEESKQAITELGIMDLHIMYQERRKELIQNSLLEPTEGFLLAERLPIRQPNSIEGPKLVIKSSSKLLAIWSFVNYNIISTILGGLILAVIVLLAKYFIH